MSWRRFPTRKRSLVKCNTGGRGLPGYCRQSGPVPVPASAPLNRDGRQRGGCATQSGRGHGTHGPGRSGGTARRGEVPGPQHPAATPSARRHDGAVRPWKRRLSDDERSVLLSELLLRHPELVAEAEEITSTLLVVENDQELADEIAARLRALRASGPVSVDTGRGRILDVLQPHLDDLTRRNERGARRAAADIAIAVLFGLYECRQDTDEDLLLVRMGLPGAADDLARIVVLPRIL
jgi:hypothetical protein